MIANNIFRLIGDFCTDYAFAIYDAFRSTDGWWASNLMNILIFTASSIALVYWMGEMVRHSKDPNAL